MHRALIVANLWIWLANSQWVGKRPCFYVQPSTWTWLHKFRPFQITSYSERLKADWCSNMIVSQSPCFHPCCELSSVKYWNIALKHLGIKHRFYCTCSRGQNRHFRGNWDKVSKQMEVVAPREAIVALFVDVFHQELKIYIFIYLKIMF